MKAAGVVMLRVRAVGRACLGYYPYLARLKADRDRVEGAFVATVDGLGAEP